MFLKNKKIQKRPLFSKNVPPKNKKYKNYNEASNQYETKKLHPLNLYLNSKNVFKKSENPKNNQYNPLHLLVIRTVGTIS